LSLNGLRIVLDCANGAAYKVAPTILEELGADVITINDKPNGYNINDKCGALHPKYVAQKVLEFRADLGILLDGDADRLVIVDEKGNIVDGDNLIGALALFLKDEGKLKGDGCVATVMSNQGLEDFLDANQIKLFRTDVGDKYVLECMRKEGINIGGEQSGHIIFGDVAKTGDGLASALQVLQLILRSKKSASKILNPFKLYPQTLTNIKVSHKTPLDEIDGLKQIQDSLKSKGIRELIRYSGTENKLRVLVEGKDKKELKKANDELVAFLKKNLV
jgi:phosphoglucosamine mutase